MKWKTVEIGTLCDGIFDGPHATPPKTTNGPLFLGISSLNKGRIDLSNPEYLSESDFRRWTRRVQPRENDVVFSYETRLGEAAIIPNGMRCSLGRRMALMRPNITKVNPRFLLYSFLGPCFQDTIRSRTIHGSTVDRIPLIEFPRFPIRIPPRPIQDRIADILSSLDDKIALNSWMNQTLEAMAREIFQSWFVDFDPVRAKADGRAPAGMEAATAALFPDHFEDSAIGRIPKGWRFAPLDELVELQRGKTYKSRLKNLPGPVLLGLASIERNGGFRNDKLSTYGGDAPENLILRPGDLFVSLKDVTQSADLLGAVARVPAYIERGRLTQDTVKLLFKSNTISRHIIYRALLTAEYRAYCRSHATGTTNLGLSRDDFLDYLIIQPPEALQRMFDTQLDVIEQAASNLLAQSYTLAALRDTLLPKLISGELRVPEAERIVERTT
jgi:type I restriction enzyme S subunit